MRPAQPNSTAPLPAYSLLDNLQHHPEQSKPTQSPHQTWKLCPYRICIQPQFHHSEIESSRYSFYANNALPIWRSAIFSASSRSFAPSTSSLCACVRSFRSSSRDLSLSCC